MPIDAIRSQALRDFFLENSDRCYESRLMLAPCQPEEDYDRFESWSHGFMLRLKTRPERMTALHRLRVKTIYQGAFLEGWLTCDRLLCPEAIADSTINVLQG